MIDRDVALREMDRPSVDAFIARSRAAFVAQSVDAGHDPAAAARTADEVLARAFPDGVPAGGHLVFDIVVAGRQAGSVWIGPASAEDDGLAWVWDLEVGEAHRGRGVGRRAMELAEDAARSSGATAIGLHVFDDSPAARSLYESLGYRTESTTGAGRTMRKLL